KVQPHPARFEIGLFERPVVEEAIGLLGGRQGPQGGDLHSGEPRLGNGKDGDGPADFLHIDADGFARRDCAGDTALRVRHAEMQLSGPHWPNDQWSTVSVYVENPVGSIDGWLDT